MNRCAGGWSAWNRHRQCELPQCSLTLLFASASLALAQLTPRQLHTRKCWLFSLYRGRENERRLHRVELLCEPFFPFLFTHEMFPLETAESLDTSITTDLSWITLFCLPFLTWTARSFHLLPNMITGRTMNHSKTQWCCRFQWLSSFMKFIYFPEALRSFFDS